MSDGLTSLRMFALFTEPLPQTERGRLLYVCRYIRALRLWITPGAYAWWRMTDDLKAAQRRLLRYRNREIARLP